MPVLYTKNTFFFTEADVLAEFHSRFIQPRLFLLPINIHLDMRWNNLSLSFGANLAYMVKVFSRDTQQVRIRIWCDGRGPEFQPFRKATMKQLDTLRHIQAEFVFTAEVKEAVQPMLQAAGCNNIAVSCMPD